MTGTRLADLAGVSREHLSEIESGRKAPSDEWLRRVELALDRYERETGQDEPVDPEAPRLVRIEVPNVYGARALIMEGPIDDLPALEAAVDRIMRRLQAGADDK
jgi:transcriptional regulator with XRE-family HTH domain